MVGSKRWMTREQRFGLIVSASAWSNMVKLCHRSPDRETGGVLVGQYTADQRVAKAIEATAPPVDSVQASTQFVRGVHGLAEKLARHWVEDPKLHYLGEWHYHPAGDPSPSGIDLLQMRSIASDPRYACSEPVLLILARSTSGELVGGAFVFPRGEQPLSMESLPE